MWFRKVKVDGFASLRLGDIAQAEKCYRLIHEQYAGHRNDYLSAARSELEGAKEEGAAQILAWLGVVPVLDGEQLATARHWWSGLNSRWKQQLRTLLARESGRSARDEAAKRKAPISDDDLTYILSRTKFTLDSNHKVGNLEPLTALRSLEEVRVAYWKGDASFFAPLAKLSLLEELDLSGNAIDDLSFVSSLARLRVLKAGWNKIKSIEPLGRCRALTELRIDRNPIADIGPLAQLTELRVLDCSCGPLTSLEPLESLSALEELSCKAHSLEKASSLRALGGLRALTLRGCRVGRPDDESLAQTRLADLGVLASLERLEELTLDFDCGYDSLGKLPPGDCDDIAAIAGLRTLKKLTLSHAVVPSFDGLASLINLERLDLKGSVILYPSLAPLIALPKLHSLVLEGRGHEGLEQLAALPSLEWILIGERSVSAVEIKRIKALRPDIKIQ